MKSYHRQWSEDNKEEISLKAKEWYQLNREECLITHKKWKQDNQEKIKAQNKVYHALNADKISLINKNWYYKNVDRVSETSRKWYLKNKERCAVYAIKWRAANPEKWRMHYRKRRSLKKGLPYTLTNKQWSDKKLFFDNECAYCGKENPLAQEHFLALSKGGEFSLNNIIPSCKSCNCSKGAKNFFDWYPKFIHYSKSREIKILKHLGYEKGIQQLSLM